MLAKLRILMLAVSLIASQVVFASTYAQDGAVQVAEKTYCASALGFTSLDELKTQLLLEAKRLAVNELFGELITASTAVEDFVVTSDQIAATSIGFVRVSGDASYANGSNLADVCVTIRAFVTEDDLAQFEPIQLEKRLCQAIPDLSADALARFTKEEAIIQALYDYDATLAGKDREALLSLMQKITYSESGFLEGTTTYCVGLEGYVIPVEVLAFTSSDVPAVGKGGNSGSQETSNSPGAQLSRQVEDRQISRQVEDRQTAECAESIGFGQMLECSIEADGQTNKHTFEAEADDVISLQIVRTSGDIIPAFAVYDKSGQVITIHPDTSSGCTASGPKAAGETCTLTGLGRYTVVVYSNGADTTGRYRLDIQRLNNPGFSTPIEFGSPITGTINASYEGQYYTFEAEADDVISLQIVRTSGDIIPAFAVYDKSGQVITIHPDTSSGCTASDPKAAGETCTLTGLGRYTVVVYSNGADTTGRYRLDIQRLNNPGFSAPIEFGSPITGTINASYEGQYYTFEAEADDVISLQIVRTSGDIVPAFAVYDKSGQVITIHPDTSSGCTASDPKAAGQKCTLTKSGQYTVLVYSNSADTTGSFTLTIDR